MALLIHRLLILSVALIIVFAIFTPSHAASVANAIDSPARDDVLYVENSTRDTSCLIEIAGDVNVSGAITSADIRYLVEYVFKGAAAPLPCARSGDVNCDGAITASDIIYLVSHVFKGGWSPCDVCNFSTVECVP